MWIESASLREQTDWQIRGLDGELPTQALEAWSWSKAVYSVLSTTLLQCRVLLVAQLAPPGRSR